MINYESVIAVFFTIYGVLFISGWIIMLFAKKIPAVLTSNIFMLSLHLLSELLPSILGIILAIFYFNGIYLQWVRILFYFNLGLIVCFTFSGAYYSLIQKFTPSFLFITGSFLLISVAFLISGFPLLPS